MNAALSCNIQYKDILIFAKCLKEFSSLTWIAFRGYYGFVLFTKSMLSSCEYWQDEFHKGKQSLKGLPRLG
uniref:Uncharacterized protein n=1 Tax=Arundo donax TaxID=35708 RepID=A0A0A9CLX2_ARUDO